MPGQRPYHRDREASHAVYESRAREVASVIAQAANSLGE